MPYSEPLPLGSLTGTQASHTERLRAREQNRFQSVGITPSVDPYTYAGLPLVSPFPVLTFTAGVNGMCVVFGSLTAQSNSGGSTDTAIVMFLTLDGGVSTQIVGGSAWYTLNVGPLQPLPLGGMGVFFGLIENTAHTVEIQLTVTTGTSSWTLTDPQLAVWPI